MNHLSPEELLTRYITTKRHFSRDKHIVKPQAFHPMPNPQTSILETSVFRVSGVQDQEIWNIGEREVAQKSDRNLHARADILTSKVFEKDLDVNPDDIPPRHAIIIGWPEEESKWRMIAVEIAADAKLHLK